MNVTQNVTCHVAALHSGLLRLLSVLICFFCGGFLHVESSSVIKAASLEEGTIFFFFAIFEER